MAEAQEVKSSCTEQTENTQKSWPSYLFYIWITTRSKQNPAESEEWYIRNDRGQVCKMEKAMFYPEVDLNKRGILSGGRVM